MSPQPATAAARKRILIVEDNEPSLRLVHDLLTVKGFDLIEAQGGVEAVRLAHENRPDLILMDIQLPDISGMEVTRQLKTDDRTSAIPIIAVTAFAMAGDRKRFLEGGCDAYLAKPIGLGEFMSAIEALI